MGAKILRQQPNVKAMKKIADNLAFRKSNTVDAV